MKDTLSRRYPLVEILLSPTSVQGDNAPGEIVAALDLLFKIKPDLIIIGRGGGSIEDLWAFNDEMVARAVAASPVPVISGVGHETDFTITDFTADLRAPTPTAAAELAVPDQRELRIGIEELNMRINRSFQSAIADQHWKLETFTSRIARLSPIAMVHDGRQRLDELTARLVRGMGTYLNIYKEQIGSYQARLAALNPESILKRGYAMLTTEDGSTIYQVGQTKSGQQLQVRVSDGEFEVVVS
jgi:exodeoxyribonuclease VII large subunit